MGTFDIPREPPEKCHFCDKPAEYLFDPEQKGGPIWGLCHAHVGEAGGKARPLDWIFPGSPQEEIEIALTRAEWCEIVEQLEIAAISPRLAEKIRDDSK